MPWFSLTMQRVLLCVCAWSREGEDRESLLCELLCFMSIWIALLFSVAPRQDCYVQLQPRQRMEMVLPLHAQTHTHAYTLAPAISQDSNSHNNIVIRLWVQTAVWAERKRQSDEMFCLRMYIYVFVNLCFISLQTLFCFFLFFLP